MANARPISVIRRFPFGRITDAAHGAEKQRGRLPQNLTDYCELLALPTRSRMTREERGTLSPVVAMSMTGAGPTRITSTM